VSLATGQNNKKVLIIGIDGCRSDALQIANTPNLNALINNGIYSPDALNDDITISGPGWSANLCGVWSNKHQVTDNTFIGDNYANYPSIFRHIEEFNNNLHTVSICNWAPINDYIVQNYADFKFNVSTDQDVNNVAVSYIITDDPDLMFLHFDDVDHAGHSYGFSPNVTEYISAIEGVDGYVGSIIQAILQRPNYANEDWLILVTTDHGGLGYSHGGNSSDEENVFVIASGNSFPTQVIYKDSSVIVDSAFNCLGDSVNLQFDGNNDYIQVPSNSVYDFGTAQDFTVECRVRTSVSGDVAIVGNKDWVSGSNKGFVFSFKYPLGPEWKVNIGDGFNRADINTGGSIADNQWHTLSVSFDRDGYMKMYEDGALLDSADISSIGDITTGQGLFFGADISGAYGFSGSIAEVRIWNNLLDESSIQSWFCSRPNNTHPYFNDLIGYWKLNEGTGSNATDYSSLVNNGIINGATWNFMDSTIVYDYSLTPRITDVAVTALTHLCVPIDSNWDLDGNSLIPACNTTSIQEDVANISLYPNPTNDLITLDIEGYTASINTQVYDLSGRLLKSTNNTSISLKNYAKGIYVFRVAYSDRVEELKVIKD
jgi:hypothetical protein